MFKMIIFRFAHFQFHESSTSRLTNHFCIHVSGKVFNNGLWDKFDHCCDTEHPEGCFTSYRTVPLGTQLSWSLIFISQSMETIDVQQKELLWPLNSPDLDSFLRDDSMNHVYRTQPTKIVIISPLFKTLH